MDSNALVAQDIELGREFVDRIARSKRLRLEAAFWWHNEEEWRFVVATPIVHQYGRLEAHRLIRAALEEDRSRFKTILDRLDTLSPSEGLVSVLDIGSRGRLPLNRQVRGESVGSAYIPNAFFYRFAPKTFVPA